MARNRIKDFEVANCGGVYGIFVDKTPIYIGYTMRHFQIRFNEHQERIEGLVESDKKLYKEMTDYEKENYSFKILFNVAKVSYRNKVTEGITRQDLKCIEFAFINLFKPKYNESGNAQPYYFT